MLKHVAAAHIEKNDELFNFTRGGEKAAEFGRAGEKDPTGKSRKLFLFLETNGAFHIYIENVLSKQGATSESLREQKH